MAPKDQDTIEIKLVVANDQKVDGASGEGSPNQISLTAKLIPIVRLLAKQAAAIFINLRTTIAIPIRKFQGSNADAPCRHLRPLFF